MYNRIRELREDKDLTQKQIGQLLGMSQTGYSQYEIGKNDIPTQILVKLAIFYNTSIDYLLRTNKSKIALSTCEKRVKKKTYQSKGLFCAMIGLFNFNKQVHLKHSHIFLFYV